MATENVMGKVYETLLCSPGMNEAVKIDVKVSRKTILLLDSVINRGLALKDGDGLSGLLDFVPKESIQDLQQLAQDCLAKAGLVDLSIKMKALGGK